MDARMHRVETTERCVEDCLVGNRLDQCSQRAEFSVVLDSVQSRYLCRYHARIKALELLLRANPENES